MSFVFRVFNEGLVWYGCFYVLVCTNAEPTLAGTNLHWSTYLVNRYSFSADRVQWRKFNAEDQSIFRLG
jgi:hypothetical protein